MEVVVDLLPRYYELAETGKVSDGVDYGERQDFTKQWRELGHFHPLNGIQKV
jgi:hypothetical protein